MATTTTTQVNSAESVMYDRLLLERAKPFLQHLLFGQRRNIMAKSSNTIKYRRYTNLSVATTPLAEGQAPTGSQLAKTDLTAVLSQYGDFIEITDVVDLTVEDAVMTEAVELLGQQMGETIDAVVRDTLSSTASATNASNGSNGGTPTEITAADVATIVKTLMNNSARMISRIIPAGGGEGTVPIAPSYFMMSHTAITDDLRNMAGWVDVQSYGQLGPIVEGEYGSINRVRVLVSPNGKATTESPVQYHNFIVGQNAYGVTELENGTEKIIIKAFGSGGTADPLNQVASVGWKTFFVSRVLNDNFIHNLEVTHS